MHKLPISRSVSVRLPLCSSQVLAFRLYRNYCHHDDFAFCVSFNSNAFMSSGLFYQSVRTCSSLVQWVSGWLYYNRSSVTFASCDWWLERFLKSTNRKILFLKTYFFTFYFYTQVIKKWNSKLSGTWSIKVKQKSEINLKKCQSKRTGIFFISTCLKTDVVGTPARRF